MLLINDFKSLFKKSECYEYYKSRLAQDNFYIRLDNNLSEDDKMEKYRDAAAKRYIEAMQLNEKAIKETKEAYKRIMIRMFTVWATVPLSYLGSILYVRLFY